MSVSNCQIHGLRQHQNPSDTVDDTNPAVAIRVATGELDDDGMEEIVVIRDSHDGGDIRVYTFDAEAGLSDATASL